jgi:hypothetical protein
MPEEGERTSQRLADPSPLTTAALQREVASIFRELTTLKEQSRTELSSEIKVLEAKITAIDKATGVFQENLTRVPTEVQKAVQNLRDLHETRLDCLAADLTLVREIIQTRFEGMDRALNLLQAIADRFPERIDEKISALKEIHGGQFDAIQVQFKERDVRTAETSKQSEVAISAALQAAKEAVGKSEVVTSKQIEDVKALFNTLSGALRDRLDEFTERFARLEGTALGQAGQKSDQHTGSAFTVSVIAVAVAFGSALMAAALHFMK